jgi:hypothetical protein
MSAQRHTVCHADVPDRACAHGLGAVQVVYLEGKAVLSRVDARAQAQERPPKCTTEAVA